MPYLSQHCSISQQGSPPSFLGVCCSALSLLLLTLQGWLCFCSPLKVDASLCSAALSWHCPLLACVTPFFPGFHLVCLRMTIKSAPSSHASHLHTQHLCSLQVFSNGVSQRLPEFSAPKETTPPVSLGPVASPIIFSPSTQEMIQRHL